MPYRISFEPNPKPEDVSILENGIIEGEMKKRGHDPIELFAFFIRDENNKVLIPKPIYKMSEKSKKYFEKSEKILNISFLLELLR